MIFNIFSLGLIALNSFVVAYPAKVHYVSVGANGKLAYDPEYITGASPGDVVKFTL
jgi:hypothetical protein